MNVAQFQAAYTELELARANYNVVVSRCVDYLTAVEIFFNPPDHKVNRQTLASVLASERLYMEVTSTYATKLIENIARIQRLENSTRPAASEP